MIVPSSLPPREKKILNQLLAAASQGRELRFTRNSWGFQATLLGVFFWGIGLCILGTSFQEVFTQALPQDKADATRSLIYTLIPLILGFVCLMRARWLLKHAYIICSPISIDIFPLKHAEKDLIVIPWGEIVHHGIKENGKVLFLSTHEDTYTIPLTPLRPQSRYILAQVLEQKLKQIPLATESSIAK